MIAALVLAAVLAAVAGLLGWAHLRLRDRHRELAEAQQVLQRQIDQLGVEIGQVRELAKEQESLGARRQEEIDRRLARHGRLARALVELEVAAATEAGDAASVGAVSHQLEQLDHDIGYGGSPRPY